MESNVFIRAWMGDELVHDYAGHNIWIDTGREWLADLIPDASLGGTENRRVRYMGFGVGGIKQNAPTIANVPPVSTSYPGTNLQNPAFPVSPLIETMERPVRVTGGSGGAYPVGPPDAWLAQPPPFEFSTGRGGDVGVLAPLPPVVPPASPLPAYTSGVDTGQVIFRSRIDTKVGQLVYPPFDVAGLPLSEIGLFLSGADPNEPFNPGQMVAYHAFGTMLVVAGMVLEFSWTVSFK